MPKQPERRAAPGFVWAMQDEGDCSAFMLASILFGISESQQSTRPKPSRLQVCRVSEQLCTHRKSNGARKEAETYSGQVLEQACGWKLILHGTEQQRASQRGECSLMFLSYFVAETLFINASDRFQFLLIVQDVFAWLSKKTFKIRATCKV